MITLTLGKIIINNNSAEINTPETSSLNQWQSLRQGISGQREDETK